MLIIGSKVRILCKLYFILRISVKTTEYDIQYIVF